MISIFAAIEETPEQHGVRIKDRELLKRVFTHDSYVGDGYPGSQSNEEPEFSNISPKRIYPRTVN